MNESGVEVFFPSIWHDSDSWHWLRVHRIPAWAAARLAAARWFGGPLTARGVSI